MSHHPVTELKSNPKAAATLKKILELAPNHLSAATLLLWAEGHGLTRLSLTGSLEQTAEAMSGIKTLLKSAYFIGNVDTTAVNKTRDRIQSLRRFVDPAVNPIIESAEEYCASADRLAEAIQDNNGDRNALQNDCFKKAATVRNAFRRLVNDDDAVDKLLRGE